MKLERGTSIALAVGTALVNWLVFYLVAGALGSAQAVFIATVLIFSIIIHELGHLWVLEANGIRTHLIFLVILGGACPDKRDQGTEKRLSGNIKAFTYLAGVFGNLVMVGLGFTAYLCDVVSEKELLQIVNLNAVLIFYNMFPISITDGGRFGKIFFDSTPEDKDLAWVFRIGIPIAMAVLFFNIITKEFFLFTIPVMFWSLHFQATHDDPNGSSNPQALTRNQRIVWSAIYLAVFITSMYLLGVTPEWMTGK